MRKCLWRLFGKVKQLRGNERFYSHLHLNCSCRSSVTVWQTCFIPSASQRAVTSVVLTRGKSFEALGPSHKLHYLLDYSNFPAVCLLRPSLRIPPPWSLEERRAPCSIGTLLLDPRHPTPAVNNDRRHLHSRGAVSSALHSERNESAFQSQVWRREYGRSLNTKRFTGEATWERWFLVICVTRTSRWALDVHAKKLQSA